MEFIRLNDNNKKRVALQLIRRNSSETLLPHPFFQNFFEQTVYKSRD